MKKNAVKTLGLLILAAGLATGCATTSELEAVRAEAAAAKADAAAAKSAAAQAQATADRAERSAADANSCCQANTERLERAFTRGLRK